MQKMSMGLSVCIAICIVSVFCLISIAIVENIDASAQNVNKERHMNLENNKDLSDFVL